MTHTKIKITTTSTTTTTSPLISSYQSDREKITLSLLFNEKLVNLLIKD
jgi:hypothetical protein